MAGLYIGVDVGTQGAKAVVYDAKTKSVVSRGAFKYDLIKTNVPGRAEQHPSQWIEVNIYCRSIASKNSEPYCMLRCARIIQYQSLLILASWTIN